MQNEKDAKQKLIDEARLLRSQWATVIPKETYESAIKNIKSPPKPTISTIHDALLKESAPRKLHIDTTEGWNKF